MEQKCQFYGHQAFRRFVDKGNIMPESDGLILPFEAINLNAVDIEVVKVFSNNIFNTIKPIMAMRKLRNRQGWQNNPSTKIQLSDLNSAINKNSWVRYGLDLNKLITMTEMQSIRLESGLGEHTSYICKADNKEWKEKRNYCLLIMLLAKIFKVSMITITMVLLKNIRMIMIGQIMKTHANHNIIPNRILLSKYLQIQPRTHCKRQ
jgi:hypothetical protein